jgi:hypothetical protein
LEWIIDWQYVKNNVASVPNWIVQNPDIDKAVWTKKAKEVTITARLTDTQLEKLTGFKGQIFRFTDGIYIYTGLIKDVSAEYEVHETHPWTAEIKFLILQEGTATIDIEISTEDWGYFKRQGEIYVEEPEATHGGGYFQDQGEVFVQEPESDDGGGYFDR